MFDIREYGSVGDGNALDTPAIQRAIDSCAEAGGGQIYIPAGIYLTGTIFLKSNCTLYLENGAELRGSTNIVHYRRIDRPSLMRYFFDYGIYALIIAQNVYSAGITGFGRINAQGQPGKGFPNAGDSECKRPFAVVYSSCHKMFLHDITIVDPPAFAFYGIECVGVQVRGVRVDSWDSINGDGLDFDGSRDVTISDCLLETGDDSISLKSTNRGYPCENYTINNCIFRSKWAGIRIGVESTSDMRNITVSNCVFENCNDGLKIQTCSGGAYEDIRFSNLTMRGVRRPVLMTQNCYSMSPMDPGIRPQGSVIRRLSIDGLTAVLPPDSDELGGLYRTCFVISGIPSSKMEDIALSNITLTFPGGGLACSAERFDVPELLDYTEYYVEAPHFAGPLPAIGIFLRHINGLMVQNCHLRVQNLDARPMIFAAHVRNASFLNVRSEGAFPLLFRFGLCEAMDVRGCIHNGLNVENVPIETDMDVCLRTQLAQSLQLEADMTRWAEVTDRAMGARLIRKIATNEWKCRAEDGALVLTLTLERCRTYLYLPAMCGNMTVYADGHLLDSMHLPDAYPYRFIWAVELTDFITQHPLCLTLVWEKPCAFGGLYGKVFRGESNGTPHTLLAPAEIRAE